MFGWFRRLWSRDHRRCIFTYHNGTTYRRADPLAVGAVLERECPKYADYLELIADATPIGPGPAGDDIRKQKAEAITELIRATRVAFGVVPLDADRGLTEAETLALFRSFLEFLAGLADAARPFVNSQPRDAPCPPDSPTTPSAASGSVAT